MNKYFSAIICAVVFSAISLHAEQASAPYKDSSINAKLNVTVKEDTDVVHFVRDNSDPDVITKVYEIKSVDPYELRSYLRKIVQTRTVNENNTNVETVQFTDGTAFLIVSAEDYRFEDTPQAQGFDTVIKTLDRKDLVSSSGRKSFLYSPKYRSARELMEMVREIGAYTKDDEMNNIGGTDKMGCDDELNLIFFKTAPFSANNIIDVLKKYDQPYPQLRAKITVYELYAENDTKLGLDFQAWKNNDGIDFLSVGGRFSQNHNSIAAVRGAKWNDTTYFQFNPKWNTKYIDFLTTRGKAKIIHSSELTLRNNTEGNISKTTELFVAKNVPVEDDFYTQSGGVADVEQNSFIGRTADGKNISVDRDCSITVLKQGKGNDFRYTLKIGSGDDAVFLVNGNDCGKKVRAITISENISDELSPADIRQAKGSVVNTENSGKFGFDMTLTPTVNSKATKLNVRISNSSLIGYTSDGSPRIQKGNVIESDFMISNNGTRLVIGGIEKSSVIKVSGGFPILKDLPVLGWLFSTETEATKRSQLLVVAEVLPENVTDSEKQFMQSAGKKLEKAGVSNTYGYRQYLIDKER